MSAGFRSCTAARPVIGSLLCAGLLTLGMTLAGCAAPEPAAPAPPALELYDLDGAPLDPLAVSHAADVFIFVRTDCPISNRYAPEIIRLADRFAVEGVPFSLVYVDREQGVDEILEHREQFGLEIATLRDPDHALVELTGATVTPEVVVFDEARQAVYRGRIDNRYVDFGRTRQQATRHDLEQALEAVLRGDPVAEPVTRAVGCYIADLR